MRSQTAFLIRHATETDLPRLLALFAEAAAWLADAGHDQWQYDAAGRDRVARKMRADIAERNVWTVQPEGSDVVIGTITVDNRADPELWSIVSDQDNALYVHRMIVARSAAGQRIGSSMLDWASVKAAAAEKKWLRLDAWASNRDLQSFYRREGFDNVHTWRFSHRGSGALFQRSAGSQARTGPDLIEVAGSV